MPKIALPKENFCDGKLKIYKFAQSLSIALVIAISS
jgi:hypothetical protein